MLIKREKPEFVVTWFEVVVMALGLNLIILGAML